LRTFLVLALASAVLSSSCASLVSKRTQRIPVTSSPAGATVSVNGVLLGATPVEIRLRRAVKGAVIRIESIGYEPVEIRPRRRPAFAPILCNILMGLVCTAPIVVGWMIKNDEDYGAGIGVGGVAVLSTAAFTGLFAAIDFGSKKAYEFTPKEMTVAMKKLDGPHRVRTIVVDPDVFAKIRWIRVRLGEARP
jgi:hypothetical protein